MTSTRLRDLYDRHIDAGDDGAAEQVAGFVDDVEAGVLTEAQALAALASV
ncbi:hypothetical protein [Nocardioides bigeumensis]|uniref:Anthranilate phosphoribosyltransferase n=1 Tax=Nocardioides bigeumensis TaxID=433657 RepID=A0ABN2XK13_9ACTN